MISVLYRQYFLKYNYGYYTGALDGISGSGTKAAIKKFQRGYGLSQDGIWGTNTNAKAVAVTKELQTLLNKYGAGLTVDGVLGQKTAAAIKTAQKKLGLTLSVSLHAPTNEMRSSMMPVNDAYPLEKLIPACRAYQRATGRRISFEYSIARGVNDSEQTARKLAKLIEGMGAHVNLIPINPVDGSPYSAADAANVRRFQNTLLSLGVNATVRRRLGTEISAACGQLRREANKEGTPANGIVRQN